MMKFHVIALVCLLVVAQLSQAAVSGRHQAEWMAYKLKHGKSYASQVEDASRMANFLATKGRVDRHNAQSGNTYVMGLNHMADWSSKERAQLNGFRLDPNSLKISVAQMADSEAYLAKILGSSGAPIPEEMDWRQVPGRVGPVGDQGPCGSCWAFSTVGLLEGQEVVRNVTKTSVIGLSEQELVDCSKPNNLGCMGGSIEDALNDIARLGGIESDKDYPYKGKDQKCSLDTKKVVLVNSGSVLLPQGDEEKLKETVATYGPVSIAIYASDNFHFYESGVLNDHYCTIDEDIWLDLNHALLIVGYGTDPKQGDFWILKNSWSEYFGEQGYVRIKRGVNMCGIALLPTIAKFD